MAMGVAMRVDVVAVVGVVAMTMGVMSAQRRTPIR